MTRNYRKITAALISATCLPLLIATPQAGAEESGVLIIENFVGRVEVVTSPDAEFDVIAQSNTSDVSFEDTRSSLTINGGIRKPDSDGCSGYYGKWSWNTNNKKRRGEFGGYDNIEDYPSLTITGPDTMRVVTRNSIIIGEVGNIGTLKIDDPYCSRLTIGDISGDANLNINGSGDFTVGNAGNVEAEISGSGDVTFEEIRNADLSVRGSGDFEASAAQNVLVSLRGSGDVEIESVLGNVQIDTRGSGDVEIGGRVANVSVDTAGSSDVSIEDMDGALEIQSRGSSYVEINGGQADPVNITVAGSGTIDFEGTARNADLSVYGSGDINIDRVIGKVRSRETGSGGIDINSYD